MKKTLAIGLLFLGLAAAAPLRAQRDPDIAREAAALGAPNPALGAFLAKSATAGVPRDFTLEVLKEAQALEARGIPSEPYLLKANEGLAKGVPPAKLEPALRQTRQRGESAAALVDRAVPGGVADLRAPARRAAILQVQSAMLNGKSPADLEKGLRSKAQGGKLSWEEIDSEARSLRPRRHGVVKAKPTPKRELPVPPQAPAVEREKGPKEKGPAELRGPAPRKDLKPDQPRGPKGRPEWHPPERRGPEGKSGKGPSPSQGFSGKSNPGKGKDK
ncbi:MAG: hypothetical protein IT572_03085 [Deltaproteobacteria bacterium]|nr:hypothetical protein [Deltaproteobacteria bacterium]